MTAYELEDHLQSRESHDIKAEINKDTFYFITIVFFLQKKKNRSHTRASVDGLKRAA